MTADKPPVKPDLTRESLKQPARNLGLALTDAQLDAMLAYLGLIQKWNKVYNLTAVRDPAEMLTLHLLDSLAVVPPLKQRLAAMAYAMDGADETPAPESEERKPQPGESCASKELFRLLDVGSGAGLPGIVIAICCPEVAVDCVDTVAKKAAFINQVAVTLKLPNLRGIHARVENLAEKSAVKYHVISSRAFASLLDFTALSANALGEQGVWLAMKAKRPADEMAALPKSVEVFHVEQLKVPGLDAERCIVWMRKSGSV